jgi:hypothetical protein
MVENAFRGLVVKHFDENAVLVTNTTSGLKSVQHAPST